MPSPFWSAACTSGSWASSASAGSLRIARIRGPACASEVRSDARKTCGSSRASSGTSAEVGELARGSRRRTSARGSCGGSARVSICSSPLRRHVPEDRVLLQRREARARAGPPAPRRSAWPDRRPVAPRASTPGPSPSAAPTPVADDPARAGDQVRAALIDALRHAGAVGRVEHAAEHRQQQDREPGLQRAEAGAAEAVVRAARGVVAAVALGADQAAPTMIAPTRYTNEEQPSRAAPPRPACEKPVSTATARPSLRRGQECAT